MKNTENFLNLDIHLNGQKIEKSELLSLREKNLLLIERLEDKSKVFLSKQSPLEFALSFLLLLDKGHLPVALPSKLTAFQKDVFQQQFKDDIFIFDEEISLKDPCQRYEEYMGKNVYASLTSGSTSKPKLCYFEVERGMLNAKAHCKSIGLESHHHIIQSLPIYHSFGIMAYIWSPLMKNCSIEFNTGALGLRTIKKRGYKNGYLPLSPSQLRMMIKEKVEGSFGLEIVSVGGGLAHDFELQEFSKKMSLDSSEIFVTYGLSEAGPRVSTGRINSNSEEGYLGEPIEGVEIKVNENSELLVKTPYVKLNVQDEELEGEFLQTRDIVEIVEGSLFFKSRGSDLINVGGVSIYPADIEYIVKGIENVEDAIILPQKHKIYGEIPVLFVQSKIVKEEEVRNNIIDKITVASMPSKIIVMEDLPRTSLNKIDRKELLEKLNE